MIQYLRIQFLKYVLQKTNTVVWVELRYPTFEYIKEIANHYPSSVDIMRALDVINLLFFNNSYLARFCSDFLHHIQSSIWASNLHFLVNSSCIFINSHMSCDYSFHPELRFLIAFHPDSLNLWFFESSFLKFMCVVEP